jgi:hypothetical protein
VESVYIVDPATSTAPPEMVYVVQHPRLLTTTATSSVPAALAVESVPPASHDASAAILRTLDDEQEVDTDFNAQYQEVFSRIIKTPGDMEDRVRDMQRVIAAFVQHAQVPLARWRASL